jgi:hypothetical protein
MASLLDLELGNGPAQTDPNAVRRLGKQVGLLGLSFAPGAGITDYAGMFPAVDGGFEPSAVDNWRSGNYGTSLLQGLGAFGDSLSVLGPAGIALGGVVKAPRALQKGMKQAQRLSKAENEAAGLYHPIGGGLKLDRPVSEMSATRVPVKDMPPRVMISPEILQGGKVIPAVGDRTAAGSLLTKVDETPLSSPVLLEGGPDFMRTHLADKAAWASDKGVITRLSRQIQDASKSGDDVFMAYSPMGHTAGDFSTMMSDTLLSQLPNKKILKKDLREFNKEVREVRPDFLGIDHPEVRDQLLRDGQLRIAVVDRMGLAKYQEMGFPSVPSSRAAILEPDLMEVPLNASGFAIAKMDPSGKVLSSPRNPHTTYNTQLGGEYVGGFDVPIPRELMFRDFFGSRRAQGAPTSGDNRAFMLSNVTQNADQQWLDGVMTYAEKQKKLKSLLD